MALYRILSIDGGGIRGLLAAVLLERLAEAVPGFLNRIDLFAGTSTGGILTLGLAKGLSPSALVALYRDNAQRVFDETWLRDLRDLGGLTGAKYDNSGLRDTLQGLLGDATLAELPRRVLVPTFDLDNHGEKDRPRMWKPKFFHNYPGPDSDGQERVVDVAMRTSAAPTYFPVYQRYIDGGVMANNPSMAAVAQALDPGTGNQVLADLRLFALGTGDNPTYIEGENLDWGLSQWAHTIVSLMIDGTMGVADYQCARLLGPNYYRLAPSLEQPIALDAKEKTEELIAIGQAVDLGAAVDWLHANF